MAKLQVFNVPNDIPGRKFIRYLKKYLNRDTYMVRVRGRHSNRKKVLGKNWDEFGQNDIQLKDAEKYGVYLDFKNSSGWRLITTELQRSYNLARNNANITETELNDLRNEYTKIREELKSFQEKTKFYAGTGVSKNNHKTTSRKIRLKPERKNDNKK